MIQMCVKYTNMKRFLISICIILYTLPVYSLSSYSATYNLHLLTNLGSIKLGIAEYELILANQAYIFKSFAKTDLLWRALYDYSVDETSVGLIKDNLLIGNYYKINETSADTSSEDYEINIYPTEHYATMNNETKWYANSINLVDALSIYLHISEDIQRDLNKKVLSYQLVDKKGINQREFNVVGRETITIDSKEFETIRIECSELKLIINISMDHNFMPINIEKTNGTSQYRLSLKDFKV
jgi:hypothetical protein